MITRKETCEMKEEIRMTKNTLISTVRRRNACLFAVALMFTSGCSKVSLGWSEEVRLTDGQVIVVDRTAKGEKNYEIGGPGGWNQSEMSVHIRESPVEMRLPPDWREAFVPILLDYQPSTNTWSLVATFYFCSKWYELGKPALPYVEYQSRDGGDWMNVPLEERLINKESNLLTGPNVNGEPKLLRIKDKVQREINSSESFKRIVSEWNGC